MSEAATGVATSDDAAAERHASWLELFFDLVVAAGMAQVAHPVARCPAGR
jgi:low temperature requirement protein LtrA